MTDRYICLLVDDGFCLLFCFVQPEAGLHMNIALLCGVDLKSAFISRMRVG